MNQSSRIPPVLIAIGRLALLMQIVYLCAYVGWRCIDDRLYSVPNAQHDRHQFAERLFSPLQNLTYHVLNIGSDTPSVEAQTLKARMTLERMGHRTE